MSFWNLFKFQKKVDHAFAQVMNKRQLLMNTSLVQETKLGSFLRKMH